MNKRQMAQYTVRSLPQDLDRRLRQTARENGKSLNEVVLEALKRASGLGDEPVEHRDLDTLVGSWKEDPDTFMMGKPVIRGTRITVEVILEKLATGETVQQILAAHPRLTEEAIRAALAFAAEALHADVIYPLSEPTREAVRR